jgi:DNA-binding NtrC family response regulator
LREKKEDIPILIRHFMDIQNNKTGKMIIDVARPAMRILLDYNWPGNVRELENAIEHAFVLCRNKQIDIFDLPVEIRQVKYTIQTNNFQQDYNIRPSQKKKLNHEVLLEILTDSDWNKAEVARRVGLSRASIWKYMKKWDIPLKKK